MGDYLSIQFKCWNKKIFIQRPIRDEKNEKEMDTFHFLLDANNFFPSKYTPQCPFQTLPATGTAADYEPTRVWGTCSTQVLNFCLSFLCLMSNINSHTQTNGADREFYVCWSYYISFRSKKYFLQTNICFHVRHINHTAVRSEWQLYN